MMIKYGLPFFVSLALSLILTPLARRFALKFKFVSFPKQDRWRRRVVASLGGMAIFCAFIITYLIFGAHDMAFIGFLLGSLAAFWLGLVDDIVHIKPDTKLIGQIIAACVTIMFGISFNLFSSSLINIPLTILWIVGVINAFNLLDNMDGLCAGVAAISAFTLCAHSFMGNNYQLSVLALIIMGSALGFLRYNFNPAKIFMGDCGSMFLGYALATFALMGAAKEKSGLMITMFIPVLVLAVPIFDTIFVTLTRMINNKPISHGGKDHTSHRLVALGLSERKAVLWLYIMSAGGGLIAILYAVLNFVYMSVVVVVLVVGLFIFGLFLGTEVKVYSAQELDRLKNRKGLNGKLVFSGFIYNKRRITEVIIDFIIISVSYVLAFLLRFENVAFNLNVPLILESLPIILIIKLVMFYIFGLYRGVWRYVGLYDIIAIFKATLLGSMLSVVALVFLFRFNNYSRTVFVIDWLITFVSVSGVRLLFRVYKELFDNIRLTGKRVLIFGAGDAGELALRELRQNRSLGYKPIGFVDDDASKLERVIHGIRVMGHGSSLEKLIHRHKVDEVLIAVPALSKKRKAEIQEICLKLNVPCVEISKIIT